jgi:hypothetical protein
VTAAQKKAFVARMKKARTAAKKKKPVTTRVRTVSGVSRKRAAKKPVTPRSRKAAGASRKRSGLARNGGGRRHGRNPDMQAEADMYQLFHGRAPERTVEYEEQLEFRSKFAELGKLLELRFRLEGEREPVPLLEFGSCQVCCTADGTNMYFLGGNQSIDLDSLGIASDKDYIELGECTYIKYFSKKGFHDFAPVDYWHKLGEEDGIRPVLAYDSLNRKLFLLGGNYRVKPEGIVN